MCKPLVSCFRFRKLYQSTTETIPLVLRMYCNIIQENSIVLADENKNPDNLSPRLGDERLMLLYDLRVIIQHRTGRFSDSRYVVPVSSFDAALHCGGVRELGFANSRTVVSHE